VSNPLSEIQAQVLQVLWKMRHEGKGSPVTAGEIREALGAKAPGASRKRLANILRRLEESGLVESVGMPSQAARPGPPPTGYRLARNTLVWPSTAAIAWQLYNHPDRPVDHNQFLNEVYDLRLIGRDSNRAFTKEEIDKQLNYLIDRGYIRKEDGPSLAPGARIDTERPFIEALARDAQTEDPPDQIDETIPQQIEIAFDYNLTPEQITGFLRALADYYRSCGGAGLSIDFELQELVVTEPENVLA
jgi:DNA-binding HxlR family transcriptional regulator